MRSFGKKSAIGFIGAGIVGKSLAVVLSNAGYPVRAVSSRTHASAQELAHLVKGVIAYKHTSNVVDAVDIIFITTPDDESPELSRHIIVALSNPDTKYVLAAWQ